MKQSLYQTESLKAFPENYVYNQEILAVNKFSTQVWSG